MGKSLKENRRPALSDVLCFLILLGGIAGYILAAATALHADEKSFAALPEGYQVKETVLSPDKKTAYILFKKDREDGRDKFYVFFDGKISAPYDAVNNFVFSPEGLRGRRFVYCAKKDGKEYFVLDGKESPPYDSV